MGRAGRPAARAVEQLGGNIGMVSANSRFGAVDTFGRDGNRGEEDLGVLRREPPAAGPDDLWERLPRFTLDPRHLARNRVISAGRSSVRSACK